MWTAPTPMSIGNIKSHCGCVFTSSRDDKFLYLALSVDSATRELFRSASFIPFGPKFRFNSKNAQLAKCDNHQEVQAIWHLLYWSCFSDFVFKIRLIKQGFSLKKTRKNPVFDSESGVLTTTPRSQLWMVDTEKLSVAFSHAWLILVEFT